ncbi:MAG: mitochondrial fission ELM1 family protein [Hyphomicrobiales bacterium]
MGHHDQTIAKSAAVSTLPLVWLLASPHAGDNTQLLALVEELGWPFLAKHLSYRAYHDLLRLTMAPTLAGLDRTRSAEIAPPFPDLIIAAGRSTESIAFWIRRHGNPAARIVYIGTPWADLGRFDLVITTPQYRLPMRGNVLHNSLPLHGVTPERLRSAAAEWEGRIADLPRPRFGVLVGGDSGPYTFGRRAAIRLGAQACTMARARGGSLLVTTSARTSKAAAEALANAIDAPSYVYRWTFAERGNPILGILALADEFVVTADSISMLAEACATMKPVIMFDVEDGGQAMRAEEGADEMPPPRWRGRDLSSTLFRLAIRFAPPKWSRDLRIVHRELVENGLARWLGERPPIVSPREPRRDMERAAEHIRALFQL